MVGFVMPVEGSLKHPDQRVVEFLSSPSMGFAMAWVSPDEIYGLDIHDSNLYEAVGRALSSWEDVELEIAILYSVLKGSPRDLDFITAFGFDGIKFIDRMGLLDTALNEFGKRFMSQEHEGLAGAVVSDVVAEATRLSRSRHQIAHGTIASHFDFDRPAPEPPFNDWRPSTYAVIPPWYSVKRLSREEQKRTFYKHYAYFTRHIRAFVREYDALGQKVRSGWVRLTKAVYPRIASEQGIEEFPWQSRWPVIVTNRPLDTAFDREEAQQRPKPQPGLDPDK